MKVFFTTLVILILTITWLHAGVIHVPQDQPSIQAGINAAVNGDTVLVADSIYYENINFKGKAITVASHFLIDGDTTHIDSTIIDGSQPGHPDSGSVVYFIAGEDTNSVLNGFTITGGSGTRHHNSFVRGGGILLINSGAQICNNIIKDNTVYSQQNSSAGGGIRCISDTLNRNYVNISGNRIINNNAFSDYEIGGYGGGIDAWGTNVKLLDNNISYNEVSGGNYCYGPGIRTVFSNESNLICFNTLSFNRVNGVANGAGGGILLFGNKNLSIQNNRFLGNESNYGGGILIQYNNNLKIVENEFIGNIANEIGGGIYEYASSKTKIIGNTINENSAHDAGGIITDYTHSTLIKNVIACNSVDSLGGALVISYIQPNEKSNKNFNSQFIRSVVGADFGNEITEEKQYESTATPIESLDNSTVLINNTICNNSALIGAGGIYYEFESVKILNSILWGNTAPIGNQIYNDSGKVSIDYSNIQDTLWQGIGNISTDPLFADTLFHLGTGSPCIDAGDPSHSCNDLDGSRNDMGAYGGRVDSLFYHITGLFEDSNKDLIPNEYFLSQNYPNPFNPSTTIEFSIPKTEMVNLKIYNDIGQEVAILVSEKLSAGSYKYTWDAGALASGVYLYELKAGDFVETKKMVLLR